MNRFKELFERITSNKKLLGLTGALLVCLALGGFFAYKNFTEPKELTAEYYYEDEKEQFLAKNEQAFIMKYLTLDDGQAAAVADEAVQMYRVITDSDTDLINKEHSDTIKNRLRQSIIDAYDYSNELTDDELNALSSGMCEIIYELILDEVEKAEAEKANANSFNMLAESLQAQIDDLKNQKVNIKAHITTEIDTEAIKEAFDSMTPEELAFLAEQLGFDSVERMLSEYLDHADELARLLESYRKNTESDLKKLEDELQDYIDGKTRNLKTSPAPSGKPGTNGKNGTDGKSTFIAYADDAVGTNFSKNPTDTSKFIGTCITSSTTYPTDPSVYSWSEYRDFIMTYDSSTHTFIISN